METLKVPSSFLRNRHFEMNPVRKFSDFAALSGKQFNRIFRSSSRINGPSIKRFRSYDCLLVGMRLRRAKKMSSTDDQQDVLDSDLSRGGSLSSDDAFEPLPDIRLPLRRSPLKDGYLYVLSQESVWFRLYVAVYQRQLKAYYDVTDKIPLISLSFSGYEVTIPASDGMSCPKDGFYPIQLQKKDNPAVCFAAESEQEQQDWTATLRERTQACSLNLEGLNLECSTFGTGRHDSYDKDDKVLAQTLELLDELLRQKSEGKKGKGKLEQESFFNKSWDSGDERQIASIVAHQEALRKATHLRQRKISTELKVENLQKQLRKPSKKSQPNPIQEVPEGREIVESQLHALTEKLRLLDSNLGQTEREALQVRREWDQKMEEVYRTLLESQQQLTAESSADAPKIYVSRSQDDCRHAGGSLRVRAARLIASPRIKKKEFHAGTMKLSVSSSSLYNATKDDSDDTKSSDSRDADDRTAPPSASTLSHHPSTKSRKSPLRIIGDFVDAQLKGRWGSTRRNKSEEISQPQVDSTVESQGRPRAHTSHDPSTSDDSVDSVRIPSPPQQATQQQDQTEDLQQQKKDAQSGTTTPTSASGQKTFGEQKKLLEACVSTVSAASSVFIDETPLLQTDSGGSCSEDDVLSTDSGGLKPVENGCDVTLIKTEIDPEVLAEIEAFEQMAQNYLRLHGRDFPF